VKRLIDIPPASVVPMKDAVLQAMGVPAGQDQGARVERMVAAALEVFQSEAQPRGIVAEVDGDEFSSIYQGAGDNDSPSPLLNIFPRAEVLTLFAVTLGASLSERSSGLFDDGSLALAATLDAAASEGTELAGIHLDGIVLDGARTAGRADADSRILRYSPGYCGWNLTGQRALFAA
jgi:hypothetical protein